MHISRKLFYIIQGAGTAALLAFAAWATHANTVLTIAAAGILGAGVVATAKRVVARAEMFTDLEIGDRESIVRWVGVASVAHVGWVAGVTIRPDLATYWAAGLLALTAGEYWTARACEYLMTKPVHRVVAEARAAKELEATRSTDTTSGSADPRAGLTVALAKTRMSWLVILDHEPIYSAGRLIGWAYTVQVPSQVGKGETPQFGPQKAEMLARALREATGVRLMKDWVQVVSLPYAGEYKISVITEDVMGLVVPYSPPRDARGLVLPADPSEPVEVDRQIDGAPIPVNLRQHAQFVGKTRSGKTSGINVKIAEGLRRNYEFWVCGAEKLYDMLAGWLQPYEGKDMKTPFDWVMYGQKDTMAMYMAMMRLARYRQNVPLSKRRKWKTIICVTDEASFVLENTTVKEMFAGRKVTASDLAAMGTKATGSADEHWWFAGQRGTNDQFGDQGGTVKTNFGLVEVYQTKDPAELGRCLGNEYYKLPQPRHKGEKWMDVGEDEPFRGKGPYIQEIDPARDHLHDGDTLADISWALRELITEEPLDEEERAVLGDVYTNRPRTADELIAYLTSEPQDVEDSAEAGEAGEPALSGREAVEAELDALLGITPPAATAAPSRAVATEAAPTTRKERIVRLITVNGQMTTGEILEALRKEEEGDLSETSVMNTLRELVSEEGKLTRPQKGVYVAA